MLLRINAKRCVQCSSCEAWLPNTTQRIDQGFFSINESNPIVNMESIRRAVASYHLDALTLEDH